MYRVLRIFLNRWWASTGCYPDPALLGVSCTLCGYSTVCQNTEMSKIQMAKCNILGVADSLQRHYWQCCASVTLWVFPREKGDKHGTSRWCNLLSEGVEQNFKHLWLRQEEEAFFLILSIYSNAYELKNLTQVFYSEQWQQFSSWVFLYLSLKLHPKRLKCRASELKKALFCCCLLVCFFNFFAQLFLHRSLKANLFPYQVWSC